jgi:DNA-binding NarL/FixJ family response regulator
MLVEGRSIPYIKETLYISGNTVKTHVRHIYQKTCVHDRQELIDLFQGVERP